MKILLTSDWYTPAVNGVVTSVLNLRRGLEKSGHEVKVLTLSQTPHSFSREGVTYLGSVPAGVVYPGARVRIASGERLIQDIMDWKPDIVHSNCEFSTFRYAHRISETLYIPLVHTYHTVYENYTHYFSPVKQWGRKAVQLLSRRMAAQTDCLIVPTEKIKKLLLGYGIQETIYVVPTGIEKEHFTGSFLEAEGMKIRKKLGIPSENTVLIFVGRLAKEKNCEELLRGAAHLRDAPFTLLFVGDGPYRHELERIAHALQLDRQVIFTGMIQPKDVSRYYHAGDLFVSASNSETQGLTYLEALSSGLPLLCRRDDCLIGVLTEGVNGWQYKTDTEFAEKIDWFMKCPEVRAVYRNKAAQSGLKFSISAFAADVEQVYRDHIRLRREMIL